MIAAGVARSFFCVPSFCVPGSTAACPAVPCIRLPCLPCAASAALPALLCHALHPSPACAACLHLQSLLPLLPTLPAYLTPALRGLPARSLPSILPFLPSPQVTDVFEPTVWTIPALDVLIPVVYNALFAAQAAAPLPPLPQGYERFLGTYEGGIEVYAKFSAAAAAAKDHAEEEQEEDLPQQQQNQQQQTEKRQQHQGGRGGGGGDLLWRAGAHHAPAAAAAPARGLLMVKFSETNAYNLTVIPSPLSPPRPGCPVVVSGTGSGSSSSSSADGAAAAARMFDDDGALEGEEEKEEVDVEDEKRKKSDHESLGVFSRSRCFRAQYDGAF